MSEMTRDNMEEVIYPALKANEVIIIQVNDDEILDIPKNGCIGKRMTMTSENGVYLSAEVKFVFD